MSDKMVNSRQFITSVICYYASQGFTSKTCHTLPLNVLLLLSVYDKTLVVLILCAKSIMFSGERRKVFVGHDDFTV